MSVTIPTTEPQQLTAGDSIAWKISLADYPASAGWYLKYTLLSSAGKISIQSSADGDDHLVSVPAATSSAWVAGSYTMQRMVTNDTDRCTLDTRTVQILADLSAATGATDTRTQARRALDAINAVLEGRASRSDAEYEVTSGGATRKLKSLTAEQLLTLQQHYTLIVWRELNPGKLCPQVRLNVRCTNG
jgi:hypothetical protein